jgi:hypothetical protein
MTTTRVKAEGLSAGVAVGPQRPDVALQAPDLKAAFDQARNLGTRFIELAQYRNGAELSWAFGLRGPSGEFTLKMIPPVKLTPERVLATQMAAFGLTLEGAREISQELVIRGRKDGSVAVRENTKSLGDLIAHFSDASGFAEELRRINPTAYYKIARKVFAAVSGLEPGKFRENRGQLEDLVRNTYASACRKLALQSAGLSAYLRQFNVEIPQP